MEEGTGEGSAYEKSTLPFNQVYCLNKNLILVWLLLLGLSEEKADFYFLFYSPDSFASGGCIVGHPVNFHSCVFMYRKYGSCRKFEILNH